MVLGRTRWFCNGSAWATGCSLRGGGELSVQRQQLPLFPLHSPPAQGAALHPALPTLLRLPWPLAGWERGSHTRGPLVQSHASSSAVAPAVLRAGKCHPWGRGAQAAPPRAAAPGSVVGSTRDAVIQEQPQSWLCSGGTKDG